MFKTTLLVALVATAGVANADVITQWNFNSTAGTTLPSTGAGTASLVGGTTATFASGNASGGSSDPEAGATDFGWNVTGFPAASAASETAGAQFLVSTVGFTDIIVSWDQRNSNSASRFAAFLYTIDGGASWLRLNVNSLNATPGVTPAGGAPASTPGLFGDGGTFSAFGSGITGAGDDWFNGRSVNLTGVPGVANNAGFGFRVVSSFDIGTSYVGSGTNAYASTGTWRFDMVTVNGVIPTPGALALAGVGGLLAIRRKRA